MDLGVSLAVSGLFLQVVFDKILTAIIQHWGVFTDNPDLPGAFERLRMVVSRVQTTLKIAQNFKRENEFLESLKHLIDAAYDAEDLMSEVGYYYRQQPRLASSSSTPPSFHHSDKDTLVRRIYEIVARLEDIVKEVREVLLLLRPVEGHQANPTVFPVASHRITTSLGSSNQTVYGRDNETNHIIEMLLASEQPEYRPYRVIPIVGMGGVGKTTLAGAIYNHERVRVEKHFDCRMWIYVSDSFDVTRLTREMLEGLKVDGFHHITNLDRLQELLEEKLESKRFLLVLDDVWNYSEKQWNLFCAPLLSGKAGSRVLLTTRLPVAGIISEGVISEGDPINLNGLHYNDYLPLFYKCAFGSKDPHSDPDLAEAGRQIACKLQGSPLAAKTLGGLLRKNLDIRYWRSILDREIWQLPQNQGDTDIIPVLKLSYQHLPAHLQQCFAFCSVFPKGWRFRKGEMVGMWISHGYILKTQESETLEDTGNLYFEELVSRSFFQTAESTEEMYVVPNFMHNLAVSVSKEECLRINGNVPNEIPRRIRHLFVEFVHWSDLRHLTNSNLRKLRTLIIYQVGDIADGNSIFGEVLKGLKSIRVLVFHPSPHILPGNLCELIHLRCLKLVISHYTTQIPDSWCKLFHLQWMIFLGKSELLSLPIGMNELVNLRRFFGDGRKFGMMVGIGKLTCLQELESFSIANDKGRMLGELKTLKELGGSLEIRYLENVTSKDEALKAELKEKRRIQELQLHCDVSHALPGDAEQVFEGLSPPDYIKRLVIDGYGGVKSPIWMVPGNPCVSYLRSLRLSRCLRWKDLPSLGQLRLLRDLEICGADAVEEIGIGFYGTGDARSFPVLETLVIKHMPQLAIWSGVQDHPLPLFPNLRMLTVTGCPLLLSLPLLPASLVELKISQCPQLPTLFQMGLQETLLNLTSLKIQDCPRITELKNPPTPFLKKLIIKGSNIDMPATGLPVTIEDVVTI